MEKENMSAARPPFQPVSEADAARRATELGLAFDVTLGSGWPGGLPTDRRNAEQQLLMASIDLSGPAKATSVPLPAPPASDAAVLGHLLGTPPCN